MFYYDLVVIGDIVNNLSTIESALSYNARLVFVWVQGNQVHNYLKSQLYIK